MTIQISLKDIVTYYDELSISNTGNANRKNLITVFNSYYANGGANNTMRIFFQGFDFVLGKADPDIGKVPEVEEAVGNDIFE